MPGVAGVVMRAALMLLKQTASQKRRRVWITMLWDSVDVGEATLLFYDIGPFPPKMG